MGGGHSLMYGYEALKALEQLVAVGLQKSLQGGTLKLQPLLREGAPGVEIVKAIKQHGCDQTGCKGYFWAIGVREQEECGY